MDYSGMKVLIMGLGLNGGGLESTRYLYRHGAEVTVTDLRDEKTLAPSIQQLEAAYHDTHLNPIRYVLGKHEIEDFKNADIVIKNPGVRPDSPFLQASHCIETDISLFLAAINNNGVITNAGTRIRLAAVTGTKGKSSTASALHHVFTHSGGRSYLGGNITVSPLAFLDDLQDGDNVTLELSSWQLGDLRNNRKTNGSPLLKPNAAVITAIMADHLDRYGSMEAYIADKKLIYQWQDSCDFTIAGDDNWGRSFLAETKATPLIYSNAPLPETINGGWFNNPDGPGYARLHAGEMVELVPEKPIVPGYHQKQNLLAAGIALFSMGLDPKTINENLGTFPGVEHRLELFLKVMGIEFYNDSAATIPNAATAALEALDTNSGIKRLVLVTGGTDKNLDFSPLVKAAGRAKAIILLAGSGSEKLSTLFADAGLSYFGPFDDLDKAVLTALGAAAQGDRVLLSPGCTSFGMFLNEFDRGRQWKEAVLRLS
jgi:UDP-N-acetylmuramoylalanine--D-glutamate ligase